MVCVLRRSSNTILLPKHACLVNLVEKQITLSVSNETKLAWLLLTEIQ